MKASELAKTDWYDLRDHIIEINEERVVFEFESSNIPKLKDDEEFKAMISKFKQVEWCCEPIAVPDYHTGVMQYFPGRTTTITLWFKEKDKEQRKLIE